MRRMKIFLQACAVMPTSLPTSLPPWGGKLDAPRCGSVRELVCAAWLTSFQVGWAAWPWAGEMGWGNNFDVSSGSVFALADWGPSQARRVRLTCACSVRYTGGCLCDAGPDIRSVFDSFRGLPVVCGRILLAMACRPNVRRHV